MFSAGLALHIAGVLVVGFVAGSLGSYSVTLAERLIFADQVYSLELVACWQQ